ncbi:MAG: hypothetical protein FWJ73_00800 [Limnochordales bacterium]|jgi:hypothetical protein
MLNEPRKLIYIGFALLLFAWIAPMLMVLDIIAPTFWLGFLSYGANVLGLALGLIGIFLHFRAPDRH